MKDQPKSEKEQAILMANKALEVPYADPDDDLRTISRQFLRTQEEITRLKAELEKERELRKELVDSLHALLKYSRRWLDEYTSEIIQSLIQKAKDL